MIGGLSVSSSKNVCNIEQTTTHVLRKELQLHNERTKTFKRTLVSQKEIKLENVCFCACEICVGLCDRHACERVRKVTREK